MGGEFELVVMAALSRIEARRLDIEVFWCGRIVGLLFHYDGFDGSRGLWIPSWGL